MLCTVCMFMMTLTLSTCVRWKRIVERRDMVCVNDGDTRSSSISSSITTQQNAHTTRSYVWDSWNKKFCTACASTPNPLLIPQPPPRSCCALDAAVYYTHGARTGYYICQVILRNAQTRTTVTVTVITRCHSKPENLRVYACTLIHTHRLQRQSASHVTRSKKNPNIDCFCVRDGGCMLWLWSLYAEFYSRKIEKKEKERNRKMGKICT